MRAMIPKCPELRASGMKFAYLNFLDNSGKAVIGHLPLTQAKIIARNLLAGKPYHVASPVYNVPRYEMSIIHIHAETILEMR